MNINLSLLPENIQLRICSAINRELKLAALENKDKLNNCFFTDDETKHENERKQLIDFIDHYEKELDTERKKPYPKCK